MKQSRDNDDVDALFGLPLEEFSGARNALAALLKKSGRRDEADRVKALNKPSVSAWAVNQLFWRHRDVFDRLIAASERFRQRKAANLAERGAAIREQTDARREVLSELLRLADALLRDSGHNPASDTMRRIRVNLEALSVYASLLNSPTPGGLSKDLDPPGFEALAGLLPDAHVAREKRQPSIDHEKDEETHPRLDAAERSVRDAESALHEARERVKKANTALSKAVAEAKDARMRKHEAEQILKKATAASEEADQVLANATAESEAAEKAAVTAERVLEEASRELQNRRLR